MFKAIFDVFFPDNAGICKKIWIFFFVWEMVQHSNLHGIWFLGFVKYANFFRCTNLKPFMLHLRVDMEKVTKKFPDISSLLFGINKECIMLVEFRDVYVDNIILAIVAPHKHWNIIKRQPLLAKKKKPKTFSSFLHIILDLNECFLDCMYTHGM